jgi:hypothetical protein
MAAQPNVPAGPTRVIVSSLTPQLSILIRLGLAGDLTIAKNASSAICPQLADIAASATIATY